MTYPILADHTSCTGCGACVAKCPVNCIQMHSDEYGFYYPQIDESKCMLCHQCVSTCPILSDVSGNQVDSVSFNLAADYETQKESASGGVFYVLAKLTIERGGYVSGAVWTDGFTVKHIVSNKLYDIARMRDSKYVQSDLGGVYERIEELLQAGMEVLFSGTPCQIAGLKVYLHDEYEKLLCINIICRGIAPSELLKRHIRNLIGKEEVEEISFRKREKTGPGIGLYIKCKSGREIKKRNAQEDSFLYEYCTGRCYRESCYECRFRNNYLGDVLIGDGGHIKYSSLPDRRMERSVAFALSEKGRLTLFNHLRKFRYVGHSTTDEIIKGKNKAIIASEYKNLSLRNQFFASTFRDDAMPHFDILLVVLWGNNYGTVMTNFALYETLVKMGYSVLALGHTGSYDMPAYAGNIIPYFQAAFLAEHMELSFRYMENSDMKTIADTVLLGSDILWNERILRDYDSFLIYSLEWFDEHVRRVSYGVSMGDADGVPEKYERLFRNAIKKYDAVSLREQWGTENIRNRYQKDAAFVMDPVFMLSPNDYLQYCGDCDGCRKPEILMYVLYMDDEKAEYIRYLENALKKRVTLILGWSALENDELPESAQGLRDRITPILTVPQWIWYFNNAEYVITDSWHGACFGVIFEKKLVVFPTKLTERFQTLEHINELKDHFISFSGDWGESIARLLTPIDYKRVKDQLNVEVEKSSAWLKCAVDGEE